MRIPFYLIFGVYLSLVCLHAQSKTSSLCTTGQHQSPISFQNVNAKRSSSLRPIQFSSSCKIGKGQEMHLRRSPDGIVGVLNGTQPCTMRDPLTGSTLTFDFMDLHSIPEHVFSDIVPDMEVQMFFKNDNTTVVLAIPVSCKARSDDNFKISEFLDVFVQQSRVFLKRYNETASVASFSTHPNGILHLLPAADRSYVSYSGSLTVPPCTEGVQWYVFTSPLHVRVRLDKDAAELQSAERNNNHRPIQPVNGRTVIRYVDPTAHSDSSGYFTGHRDTKQKSTKLLGSSSAVLLALAGFAGLFIFALCAFHHFSHVKPVSKDLPSEGGVFATSTSPNYGSV